MPECTNGSEKNKQTENNGRSLTQNSIDAFKKKKKKSIVVIIQDRER